MDYDMEVKIKKVLSKYRAQRAVGILVVIAASFYLGYLVIFKMDYRIELVMGAFGAFLLTISVFALYLVAAVIGLGIMMMAGRGIWNIFINDCDPYLYEICLNRVAGVFYRERWDCNRALAKYWQGEFEQAFELLQQINVYKLKGVFRYEYYLLKSALYFKKGMGMQVPELELAYRMGMKKSKKEQRLFRQLCLYNNVTRAMENKDYKKAFEFLSESGELIEEKDMRLNRVAYNMKEALIYEALGEQESARLKLEYVVKFGGKLFCVAEAQRILEKFNEIQKEDITNEEIYGGV